MRGTVRRTRRRGVWRIGLVLAAAATDGGVVRVCGVVVFGPLTVTGATGAVVVGDGAACGANTISGPATLTGNKAGVEMTGNVVAGPLRVTGNTGTVHVAGNVVHGPVMVQ